MGNYRVAILPAIVINYFVAFTIGFIVFKGDFSFQYIVESKWFGLAIFIGSLLIIGLYLIGYTTQRVGIAITTIANKMSVILPISFSIVYYNESMSTLKWIGIILALFSVLMAVYRKNDGQQRQIFSILPLVMFLVVGVIDSSLKLAQQDFVEAGDIPLFTASSFGLAGIIGVIILAFNPSMLAHFKSSTVWIAGILIGIVNYGTMYFLMFALEKSGLDGSIVYGINNMGIILFSILIAVVFFREKLNRINYIGISLAIIAAIMLTLLA
jgi:drug/metabolite transporter (DMT)-like permease